MGWRFIAKPIVKLSAQSSFRETLSETSRGYQLIVKRSGGETNYFGARIFLEYSRKVDDRPFDFRLKHLN